MVSTRDSLNPFPPTPPPPTPTVPPHTHPPPPRFSRDTKVGARARLVKASLGASTVVQRALGASTVARSLHGGPACAWRHGGAEKEDAARKAASSQKRGAGPLTLPFRPRPRCRRSHSGCIGCPTSTHRSPTICVLGCNAHKSGRSTRLRRRRGLECVAQVLLLYQPRTRGVVDMQATKNMTFISLSGYGKFAVVFHVGYAFVG